MVNAAAAPEEQHFILSNLSPSLAQKRLALGVVLVLLVAFFITAGPLARVQLARIDAFIPAYATAMFVNIRSPLSCCLHISPSCVRVHSS